ncbi:MAG: YIP1 family protein [Anaerolineales bacterium]|nr:YIP1 family protein [Anaerolineales bacterium]
MSVESELQRAEELLRAGYKAQAQMRLARLLKQEFRNEQAWWLMAQAQDDPKRRRDCLERVLALNPQHEAARQMLADLNTPAAPPPTAPPPAPRAEFEPPQFAAEPAQTPPQPVKFSSFLRPPPPTAPPEVTNPSLDEDGADASLLEDQAEESDAGHLSEPDEEPALTPAEPQFSYRYRSTWQPPDESEAAPAPAAPMDPASARAELERAVALIEEGRREEGRSILETLVEADPKNESAWLWLAAITRDREMKLGYLDKALAANPRSKLGRKMLAEMGVRVEAGGAVARGAGVPLPWYEVWLTALSRPNPQAYEVLLSDPEVSVSRALIWAVAAGLASGGLFLLAQTLFFNFFVSLLPQELAALPRSANPTTLLAVALLCGLPFFAFSSMLGVLLTAGLTHSGARLFGGRRPFAEQAYLTAAYASPVTIANSVLAFIPLVNCLTLPLNLYALFLNVVAVKAVNRFGWGAAGVAGLMPVFVGMALTVCAWIGLIVVMSFSGLPLPLPSAP